MLIRNFARNAFSELSFAKSLREIKMNKPNSLMLGMVVSVIRIVARDELITVVLDCFPEGIESVNVMVL